MKRTLLLNSSINSPMADNRIGVARLDVPEVVPREGAADPPDGKV